MSGEIKRTAEMGQRREKQGDNIQTAAWVTGSGEGLLQDFPERFSVLG